MRRAVEEATDAAASTIHVCFFAAPFGVVPVELSETYPLSQFEAAEPLDRESLEFAAEQAGRYVEGRSYSEVILLHGADELGGLVEDRCGEACRKTGRPLTVITDPRPWGEASLTRLADLLKGRSGPGRTT
ncbi:MAG: DUF5591 domain-containing protein [Candidatus Bathyarchaeia archaeon]